MRQSLAVLCSLVLLAGAARAAAPKAETVTYASGADKVSGYLATPTTGGKRAAIIVIHEWWGQNEWARARARSFADKGYVALAVDLYRGQSTDDADTAHQLSRGLPEDRAQRDLLAAFAYLAGRADVDPARIGVVGWCMGGGQALELAMVEPRLAAVVIYYGRLATDPARIAKIKAPLLGNFGAADKGISAESVKAFVEAAKQAGVRTDVKIFAGAGHAFASSTRPEVFKADAAREADARTDAFFTRELGAKPPGRKQ